MQRKKIFSVYFDIFSCFHTFSFNYLLAYSFSTTFLKKNVKEAHLVQHVEFLSRTMHSAKRTLRQVALLHTSSPVCRGGGALTGEAESGGGCPEGVSQKRRRCLMTVKEGEVLSV